MKKPTFFKISIVVTILLVSMQTIAQNFVPFTPRFNQDLKGDIRLIGNNILGPSNAPFNDNTVYNHNVDMQYIDIDGDGSTFNSTSADLEIPNPGCYQIVHAGLYWGAVTNGDEPITNVKFKGPTGGYNDVVGTIIYEANGVSTGNSYPYSCYADVTSIVTGLAANLGTYTVGNVSTAVGETGSFNPYNGTGYSAGWSLFIVFEDPTLPGKSITSFDGFSSINSAVDVDIPVSGFRTVPAPIPVRANFAFAALEGDSPIQNDRLQLNGVTLSAVDRPANNFFNSSVTQLSATPVNNRVPNSTNTLGFDTGVMVVPNPGNTVIGNNDTNATIRMESNQDQYFAYFCAFAVDIIEPRIVLTKIVEDDFGTNIGGQTVGLGTSLNYVIGFNNSGNDDANNLTIRDVLPINIIFNYPADLGILPPGVTVQSYNPGTREIIFNVDNSIVEQGDPVTEIRIHVQVVESCDSLADSCSNIINNQAFATYGGIENPNFIITDDPSLNSNTGCLITPQTTNFLADLDCEFIENVILCGDTVQLTAGNGYDSYSWSTSPTGTPVIGTTQTITVAATGTYYVYNTAIAPCQSITQTFVVTNYGGTTVANPVIPFADEVVTCPNDGKLLPNIFLCGGNDFTLIETQITDASSIIWEQLDESSCTPVTNSDCANENGACTWNQVGTGSNFNANTAGQFRLTINYEGGCFNQFYFNVFQNVLNPTVTSNDIICTTPGQITVGGVPTGYEYSIDGVTYQASNVFAVTVAGTYTIYIRQVGASTNPCVFTVPDVQIRARDFTVSLDVEQPLCYGDKGSITLAANDVLPQYFFSIYNGATLVNSVGPITENNYTFSNLNPGTYTTLVETEDGCTHTEDVEIIEPPLLTATSALTVPLTCADGEITVYANGGTPPYFYFVNSTTVFQTVPEIVVTTPGVYNITVIDSNNCEATTSISVDAILAPDFTVVQTNILCSGSDSGSITVNVTNTNGNSLMYSIDGGVTFVNSNVFTGLAAGNYDVVVQYTTGTSVCITDPQTITITENDPLTGTVTLTTPYSCISNGEITVSGVTGGTPPYTYSIDGTTFQNGTVFTGLTNGTYTVSVQDDSGCVFIAAPITIEDLNPPTDLMFDNSPLSCPLNTTTITITGTTGGFGVLEYQIIAPASEATPNQTSNVFAGLAPGTYTFQVTDENDCTYSESYTVNPLPAVSVVGQTISNVTCFGDSDGSIQFTVSGSTNFTYTINGGSGITGTSPIILNGLSANTYTIVVTDTITNCEATATLAVDGPTSALSISTTPSPITCNGSGQVVITAVGGWGGNSYSITLPDGTIIPAQSSNTFVNLSQTGTYTATVTDTQGCSVSTTFDLVVPTNPTATIALTSDYCYDTTNAATLEVTASGGLPPYQYSINGAPFTSNYIFNNLVPGTYTIIVRDANGCTFTLPAETILPQLTISTVVTKDLDCTTSPDAIITGTISGGYAPYTYEVSINGAAFTTLGATGSPFTYTTAVDGTYQFQITDSQGCSALSAVNTIDVITLPEILSVTQTQPILCSGDSNAAIDVVINTTVGEPVYVINVYNTTTAVDYGTQTSGLSAGSYTITLTDNNSCTDTETIIIAEPTPINVTYHAVDITCGPMGVSQGSVIVDGASGGTPPYNYFVTGTNGYSNSELNTTGSTSISFDVVDFGLYQINVVDANGCSILVQDVLVASPPDDLDINITATADCLLGGEAIVTIGTTLISPGPFFFSIYPATGTAPGGSWIPEGPPGSATFSNLIPGVTYTFIVFDSSTGCSYYEVATSPIPTNSTLTATAVTANNITCTGSADGSVSFTINSTYASATNVTYEIFDSFTLVTTGISGTGSVPANGSLPITNLGPLPFGNFFVLISETSGANTGCSVVTVPFNITESAIELSITATVDQNANCTPNSGVISAIASNGTPPYMYQITTTAGAPLATDPSWASASTFNMDANSYYVHVMDAYGCIRTTPVLVLPMDPTPVVNAVVNNQCDTAEGAFEIDVTIPTAGMPPYTFSIDGGAFQTQTVPFTIQNLNSGSHTIEVRDVNGCGNLVTVDIETPLGITPAVTGITTCSDDDGEITVTAQGGTGTYTYSISPNPTSITLSGNVFSGVPSGTYTVTITDSSTLCTEDATITLDAATPVSFTTSVTDVSCNGSNEGVITINLDAGNDNPVYTYEITAPIVVAPQNSNVFTGLPAGTYTVQVNSGRGCSNTMDVIVGEPTLLNVSGIATDFACAADGSVTTSILTITEVGGTASYTYSIDGTNYFTSNIFNIVDTGANQTITIYVKDANGCIASNTVNVLPLPTITLATVIETTPIDCNNTGSIEITVTGGSGNFEYQMLPSGTPQASNVFTISMPGEYYFLVTDLDTGCSIATAAYTVSPFNLITATATATSAVTCFGDTNGAIEINVTDYTGSYTYEVFDNSGTSVLGPITANTTTNPQAISGLSAGNYTVEVAETASPFCTTTTNVVTVTSPTDPLAVVALETSNVTCTNDLGTITATATGGWGSYQYELTGAATVAYSSNNTFDNLSAGTYTVNVMDAGGCIASDTVTLDIPTPIDATVTPSATLLSCFNDANATITVSAITGGSGSNYLYTLNMLSPTATSSGPQSSPVFGGLGVGTYQVVVTDAFSCDFTSADIVITQPTPIQASLVKETSQTCLTEATLTLSASGGTGAYSYSNNISMSPILGSFATSTTFAVPVGTHEYYVQDANGCVAIVSNEITIDPLPDLTLNLALENAVINCAGDATGVIVATAQGGLGNYIYTLLDTLGNPIPATQNSPGVFTELYAGIYVVQVASGDCLTTNAPITITEPTEQLIAPYTVTDVTCFGANDGIIVINASGGTGNIQYAISPQLNQFFNTNVFEDLAPGNYEVIVQDELGCYLTLNITVDEPNPVFITFDSSTVMEEICEGDLNGEFSIEISGGTPPYSVSLDNYNGPYTTGTAGQTEFDFTGLAGGEHTVYVRDSSGCDSEMMIPFPESVRLNPIVEIEYACVNNASSNTVTVIVDESVTNLDDVDFSLNGGPYQASNVFIDVPPGIGHYIDVQHTNSCVKRTDLFDITTFDPLTLVLTDGVINEIIATTTGGSGDYNYTFNGQDYGSTNVFYISESGTYTVTVTDTFGCEATATRYFEFVDVCIPNYFTPNGDGVQDGWGPGCSIHYPNLDFDIFDRYGRKIATLRIGEKWDGKYKGKELPTGDYWYVVRLNDANDDRDFVGHFTLYR
ncbi:T9SS type B sorting domain-containing protein [Bizionia psychrotolerans]|uniref:T9SS type B sorting domain-containing protein n=1 Tax=Bizionia psychrotolerans TaxID=1492901 RepID=UPI0009E24A0F|nr:T9SS type B sorting domain-containing protein [Bizionia psychrotolerans]